jgi:hypothetical protein
VSSYENLLLSCLFRFFFFHSRDRVEQLMSITLNVMTEVYTLTEVFPCFFLSFKANARVKLAF